MTEHSFGCIEDQKAMGLHDLSKAKVVRLKSESYEEELRKEATTTVQWECTPMIDRPTFVNGYVTGAEPREKRIAEFEGKLRRAENLNYQDAKLIKEYGDRIAELEKENAELKSIVDFQTSSNIDRYFQLKRSKEQLTKAKELLKWFIWYFEEGSFNLVPYKHKVAEAEQFLNSEVEK